MRKRALALGLACAMTLSLTACGETKENTTEATETTEATTEEEADASSEESEEKTLSVGDELITDGGFDEGIGKWTMYLNGGTGEIGVTDEGELKVSISNPGGEEHSVQPYLDEFALDSGVVYRFSFDAYSTKERLAEWRIQVNGGDYHPYASDRVTIGTEKQTFTKEFTMTEGSDPAPRLCINLGGYKENDSSLGAHDVMMDNFSLTIVDDSNKVLPEPEPEKPDINLNQIGYKPEDSKVATLRGDKPDSEFKVINVDTNEEVFTGKVSEAMENETAGETNAFADFSEVKEPGTYKLVGDACGESYEFMIADDVYHDVFDDVVRMLYLQRCGTELNAACAGDFAHPECHTGEAVIYGTDTKKDVSGGWHDAGDYGRYVVSGAKAVMDLLLAYEEYPDQFTDDMGIPESGNGIPDVIDEVRYELDWMLKMQDEATGGVYHKVTCANFPETVMPQDETDQLILCPISTTATGDFAAVMARASRIFADTNPDYAKTCLDAAKKAWTYLETANSASFKNPDDIVTGEYPDGRDADEKWWAAAELYKTTEEESYHEYMKAQDLKIMNRGLGWAGVGTYAFYTYLTTESKDMDTYEVVKSIFDEQVAKIVDNAKADGYKCSLGEGYVWGSNMVVADNAMLLFMANYLDQNEEYVQIAKAQVNYLLGTNANSYCFVTGYGSLSPKSPHHRPSQVLDKTMTGMLVGGPDCNLEDPYAKATLADKPKAKCYVDHVQSFSCNEVTVYWNSPLVYILAATK